MFKIKSGKDLVLETADVEEVRKQHKILRKAIYKTKDSYSIFTESGSILNVWYSENYDEPIQSRHYVSHRDYGRIW